MSKKELKENIQKALDAELKKEGIWDSAQSSIFDPIAGAATGLANIPRGIAGQFHLGTVNRKLERTAKRIGKEWDKADDHVKAKAEKMKKSRNPNVKRMGFHVERNVEGIDAAIRSAVERINKLTNLGADQPGAGGKSPTQHDFFKFLKKFNVEIPKGKNPLIGEGGRLFNLYIGLLQAGVDPINDPPEEWGKKAKGGVAKEQIVAQALDAGLIDEEEGKRMLAQSKMEKKIGPEGVKKIKEKEQEMRQQPQPGSKQERLQQILQGKEGQAQESQGQIEQDLVDKLTQRILSNIQQQQGVPATPQQQQAAGKKAQKQARKIKIKQKPVSQQLGKLKMPKSKKRRPMKRPLPQEYGSEVQAPAFKGSQQPQIRSQGTPEKYRLATQKGIGQVHSTSGARFEAPPEQQPPFERKLDLPPRLKPQKEKELSSEEAEKQLPLPSFADMFGVNDEGQVFDKEEESPIPLTKKKPKKSPGMAISDIVKNLGKQKRRKKSLPVKKNDEGEIQIGQAPSEDPQGVGSSGTYQAKDKRFEKKSKKKSEGRPSARAKKKK